eukprot:6213629-Pleurochrysis_carterae.AAC.2
MRAEHLTPYPHRKTALPYLARSTANSTLQDGTYLCPNILRLLGDSVGASAVSVPQGTGTAGTPLSPPQSAPEACSSRGSETRRSVPEGPGPLRSSSHLDERFRGRQGKKASSASVPEGTGASDVLPLVLPALWGGWVDHPSQVRVEESYCLGVCVAWGRQPCPGQKAWAHSTPHSRLPLVGCDGVQHQCWDQRRVPPPHQKIWRLHAL